EWFDDVVIRATIEALDAVLHLVFGSQEEDRGITGSPQSATNLEAVHAGHENIQDHKVRLEGAGGGERRGAGICRLDRVAFESEGSVNQARDLWVVVNDEDVGAHPVAV